MRCVKIRIGISISYIMVIDTSCACLTPGTSSCDVWEVDLQGGATDILVHGHESNLYGLSVNPAFPHIFATAGEAKMVVVWSAIARKVSTRACVCTCMLKPCLLAGLPGNQDAVDTGIHVWCGNWDA